MSIFNRGRGIITPCGGEVIRLEDVCDEVFSSGVMGKGFGVHPEENEIVSPIDGEIVNAYDTGHAFIIQSEDGLEVLVHIGINTVELEGEYLEPRVKKGMKIRQGDKLAYADTVKILERGYDPTVVVVITNSEKLSSLKVTRTHASPKEQVATYKTK
ncbi:MAG: PTS glucose transporter subunit IIA [Clostridia bacterium]|nr:PTS glucose transporter subunit IIA [Clostridia bacterium]